MNDTKYADAAIEQLKKKHTRPFFIACGVFHPHMPWYVPQKYLDMYPLDKIELPPVNTEDLDDIPEMGKKIVNRNVYDKVTSLDQYKEAVQGYLASTSYADAQMGRVLDALENSPYKDNTIVVLMSDHGFHLGEKLHWQKGTLWEEATNCLLMFRVPGLTKPQQVCGRTVTLQDVYPTLMELAGLPKPEHVDGNSLVSLLRNSDASWDFPALTAYQSHMTVRTDQYRLIRYTDGTTELYDRGKDPNEWVNRTDDPEYYRMKRKLSGYLPSQEDMAPAMPRQRKL
jgi:arylsulfatase A-like enzyme